MVPRPQNSIIFHIVSVQIWNFFRTFFRNFFLKLNDFRAYKYVFVAVNSPNSRIIRISSNVYEIHVVQQIYNYDAVRNLPWRVIGARMYTIPSVYLSQPLFMVRKQYKKTVLEPHINDYIVHQFCLTLQLKLWERQACM